MHQFEIIAGVLLCIALIGVALVLGIGLVLGALFGDDLAEDDAEI